MLNTTMKASLLALGIAIAASLAACQMDDSVPVAPTQTLAAQTITSPSAPHALPYPTGPLDETPITPRETAGSSQD